MSFKLIIFFVSAAMATSPLLTAISSYQKPPPPTTVVDNIESLENRDFSQTRRAVSTKIVSTADDTGSYQDDHSPWSAADVDWDHSRRDDAHLSVSDSTKQRLGTVVKRKKRLV